MRKWDPNRPLRDGTYEFRVDLPRDEEGMIGRQCPHEDCGLYFKVKPGTGLQDPTEMFCPYCEKSAPPNDWATEAQIEYGRSLAIRQVSDALGAELKKLERHSFRGGLISMEVKVDRGLPPSVHRYAERELEQHVLCESCGCEYAIYGLFAVCPDCGQHNVFQILETNLDIIRKQATLEENLLAALGEDEASQTVRDVGSRFVEAACEDLVTGFETCFKELSARHQDSSSDPTREPRGNLFQRLDDTRDWFADQHGVDLFENVADAEVEDLRLLFNKRHILTHNLGLVDEHYLQKTGLSRERLGRKIELTPEEVIHCADVVQKIGATARARFVCSV